MKDFKFKNTSVIVKKDLTKTILDTVHYVNSMISGNSDEQQNNGNTLFDLLCDPTETMKFELYVRRLYELCYSPHDQRLFEVLFSLVRMYLGRILRSHHLKMTYRNRHKLLATAIVIACKYTEDITWDQKHFSSVVGVSTMVMMKLELRFLDLVQWKLHIDEEELEMEKASFYKSFDQNEHFDLEYYKLITSVGLMKLQSRRFQPKCAYFSANDIDCDRISSSSDGKESTVTISTVDDEHIEDLCHASPEADCLSPEPAQPPDLNMCDSYCFGTSLISAVFRSVSMPIVGMVR